MDSNFTVNSRVRLKDVHPSFYEGYGCVGSEGVVKARKLDEFGYAHIYVEWDKNHWAYNGTPDTWTWENHFEKVENMNDDSNDMKRTIAEAMAEVAQKILGGNESEPEDPDVAPDEDHERSTALTKAAEILQNGESFMVITVSREPDPSTEHGVLVPQFIRFNGAESSGCMVDLEAMNIAMTTYTEMSLDTIHDMYHN